MEHLEDKLYCDSCGKETGARTSINPPHMLPDATWCEGCANARRLCINVYEVTREYGGPEEGGWWYNWSTCVATVQALNEDDVPIVIDFLKARYIGAGSIYSVLGGYEFNIVAEFTPGESESKERPHYE